MTNVHPMDHLDLNLLRVLDALLTDGSATRAARRLGVTQSAVSHGLARLRGHLGDPLLVRGAGGLVPTPRGESLREPVRRMLLELEGLLAPPTFDPARVRGALRLGAPDYATVVLLPSLVQLLEREAPGLDLVVLPVVGQASVSLADGTVDLVVGTGPGDEEGIYAQRLFDDTFTTVVRAGHPALDRPWDVDAFCAASHVLIAPRGAPGGPVDSALERVGRARRVAVRVPHFLAAAWIVAGSDLVCTMPVRVARAVAATHGLIQLEPPFPLGGFTITQAWHIRRHADPVHRWWRGRVAATAHRALDAVDP